MYREAEEAVSKGSLHSLSLISTMRLQCRFYTAPANQLQNRIMFHLSHKFGEEKRLMTYHQHLQDILEDQLSLASIHYLRSHYQEAIDIYKRILLDNRSEQLILPIVPGVGLTYPSHFIFFQASSGFERLRWTVLLQTRLLRCLAGTLIRHLYEYKL